jgi:hypothetical protein
VSLSEVLTVFIGHFAVGFASKGAAPRTSLGVLIAASVMMTQRELIQGTD